MAVDPLGVELERARGREFRWGLRGGGRAELDQLRDRLASERAFLFCPLQRLEEFTHQRFSLATGRLPTTIRSLS